MEKPLRSKQKELTETRGAAKTLGLVNRSLWRCSHSARHPQVSTPSAPWPRLVVDPSLATGCGDLGPCAPIRTEPHRALCEH